MSRKRERLIGLAESENRSMYANSLHGNREIPDVAGCHPQPVREGKAWGRTPATHASGKSDGGIVSMKRSNKGEPSRRKCGETPAEIVEKSPPAKGNDVQTAVAGTQGPEATSIGLSRVGEVASTLPRLT